MVEIAAFVVFTRWVVKMKEQLLFCREFSILCIEIGPIVNHAA